MIDTLISADVYISIPIKGVSIGDLTDIHFSIKNTLTSSVTTYSMSGGDIILSGDSAILHIRNTSVSIPGTYEIRMIVTDVNSDKLPMKLNEDYVRFK